MLLRSQFLCSVFFNVILFYDVVNARYSHDVICIFDKNKDPVCKTVETPDISRRNDIMSVNLPIYDPYIPRKDVVFYNCTRRTDCNMIRITTIKQLTNPNLNLRSCFPINENYECERTRYTYFKNIDKLLFLSKNIKEKMFYLIDCLVYSDGHRICHKKEITDTYTKLVDTGNIARPDETNILLQDEFICEESVNGEVNCDLNHYVHYEHALRYKESAHIIGDILLKTNTYIVPLKYNCNNEWCGYSGEIKPMIKKTRRRYEDPGGKLYRCYYGNRQQICKELYGTQRIVYNEREYLTE